MSSLFSGTSFIISFASLKITIPGSVIQAQKRLTRISRIDTKKNHGCTLMVRMAPPRINRDVNLLAHSTLQCHIFGVNLRIGIIAVPLALAAARLIAAWTFGRREPTYHGQPLSYWIDLNRRLHQYGSVPVGAERDVQEARAAITTIGTKAIPYLIRWIKPPLWGARFIRWAPRPSRRNLYRFNQERADRAEAAMQALEVLGTNAVSAIPELEALAMKTNVLNREIAWRAKRTLHNLGPQAYPALLNLWSNAGPAEKRSPFYYGMRDLITNTPAR